MEQKYNFKTIEKELQNNWKVDKSFEVKEDLIRKNIIAYLCFLTHLANCTWDM